MNSYSVHSLVIYTLGKKPLLVESLAKQAEHSFKFLTSRFPGLKILSHAILPDRVEMVLDLHRLDEDLVRIVQALKAEIKALARKDGYREDYFWQWGFEEKNSFSMHS
jgi:hypothetical protein